LIVYTYNNKFRTWIYLGQAKFNNKSCQKDQREWMHFTQMGLY